MKKTSIIPAISLILWLVLPIFEIIYYPIRYYSLAKGTAMIADGWYYSCYTDIFSLLGMATFVAGFGLFIYFIYQHRQNLKVRVKRNPWLVSLALLLAWAFVCTVLSDDFIFAWYGSGYRADGMWSYLIYAAIFILACLMTDERMKRIVLQVFAFSANAVAVLVVLQCLDIGALLNVYPEKGAAVFFNTNHCGYYLAMSILCAVGLFLYSENKKLKLLLGMSLALQYYALLQNNTFGCYLAVWAAMIVIYILKRISGRKLSAADFVPAALVVILSVVCFPLIKSNFASLFGDVADIVKDDEAADYAGSGRMILWKYAISIIKEHPIFGVGPEGLLYLKPDNIGSDRPHNEYLQYAAFLGLPGLGLYLFSLLSLAVHSWKRRLVLYPEIIVAGGVVTGYCISALFGNTMFYTTLYFFMMLGLVASRHAVSDR